ncbi:putative eka-like protein [Golovinomyces cichoracearum]|uniref:Putative eka-like protein n=1 Tax=Golovinomyces cichoracearum TaxID=62708 RepID=A0A420HD23_9PEZI|nr:putative eka-like protein [Golovinomyces cichoracearum]
MDFIGPFPKIPIGTDEARKLLWPHLTDVFSRYKEVFGDIFEKFDFRLPESTQADNEFHFTHILLVIDYFSRFAWAFPTTSTTSAEMISFLSWLFDVFQAPIAVYSDRQPFASSDMKSFFKAHGTMHISALVAAHRSGYWQFEITHAVKAINNCIIEKLGYSSHEVLYGFPSSQAAEKSFTTVNRLQIQAFLKSNLDYLDSEEDFLFAQLSFIASRYKKKDYSC